MGLTHGGNLNAAVARFGGSSARWIDLSTGISPRAWPVPPLPESVWQRLPEPDDGLVASAAGYYRCSEERLFPVPGSQHAIRLLPALWPRGAVSLPYWGYLEHRAAWDAAGHHCREYRSPAELETQLADPALKYAVVINPNNPLGTRWSPGSLVAIADELGRRGGYLLVDEAFADTRARGSLASRVHPALVVLRSVGKFFGLAGLRLGFVIASPLIVAMLREATNPWAVSHPARWVGALALADRDWQAAQRDWLDRAASRWWGQVTVALPGVEVCNAGLFVSAILPAAQANALHRAAAMRALWLRVYGPRDGQSVLRLGLPSPESESDAAGRLSAAARDS